MFRGLSLCVNPQAGKESSLSLKDELHIGTRFFLHNKENQRPDVPWTMGIDGIFSIDFLATKSNPITCELFFGGEIQHPGDKKKRGCQWYKGFILEKMGPCRHILRKNESMLPHYDRKNESMLPHYERKNESMLPYLDKRARHVANIQQDS